MKNWPQTVVSQYVNSTRLLALLESIDEWISPDTNLENFYSFIWDIRREGGAFGYGLDVWGRIVGVNRVVSMAQYGASFGFGEAGDRTGFNQATFYIPDGTVINFPLSDEAYRLLIFARAALNITDCSIPAINAIMMSLFPNRGNAYVTDGANRDNGLWLGFGEAQDRAAFDFGPFQDGYPVSPRPMSLTYVFEFALEPVEVAIVTSSGVLPKPVGVQAHFSYPT